MQPILMLAIAGVAAIALGTGFLNNDIELWIQDFGVGAGDIELTADHAIIDFNIIQQLITGEEDLYENVIDYCLVTLNAQVGVLDTTPNSKESEITCKITGKERDAAGNWVPSHKVLTEGKLCQDVFLADVQYHVPLGPQLEIVNGCDPLTTNPVFGPTELDPKMAGDVILVVHANTYNDGMIITP